MKLTTVYPIKENSFNVFLNDKKEGFILGKDAKIIPTKYQQEYNNRNLVQSYAHEYKRIIDRTNISELQNMKPAFAKVTELGTLIIE